MTHHSRKKVPRKRSVKKQEQLAKSHRKWSLKYKRSINCKNPRGFSQKQYCKKKSRQKKSPRHHVKKSKKKSPRHHVKKSKKKSRRRTTAALVGGGEAARQEAAQALLTIAGIKPIYIEGILPPAALRTNYFSDDAFKRILATYIRLYNNHSTLKENEYLSYPLYTGGKYNIQPQSQYNSIGRITVDNQYIDELKTSEYKEDLIKVFAGELTSHIIEKHLTKALKSAIYEYFNLRSIPAEQSSRSSITDMVTANVLPKLFSIINKFPVMIELKKLYLNITKVNQELRGVFLVFVDFYQRVVTTLVRNIGPITRSTTDFVKTCIVVVAPLLLLPQIISAKQTWQGLNLLILTNLLQQIIGQINSLIGNLSSGLEKVKESLNDEANNAINRMNNRLDNTRQNIDAVTTAVPRILKAPGAVAAKVTNEAAKSQALAAAVGPNIIGAAVATAENIDAGVGMYINNALEAMGVAKSASTNDTDESSDDKLERQIFGLIPDENPKFGETVLEQVIHGITQEIKNLDDPGEPKHNSTRSAPPTREGRGSRLRAGEGPAATGGKQNSTIGPAPPPATGGKQNSTIGGVRNRGGGGGGADTRRADAVVSKGQKRKRRPGP